MSGFGFSSLYHGPELVTTEIGVNMAEMALNHYQSIRQSYPHPNPQPLPIILKNYIDFVQSLFLIVHQQSKTVSSQMLLYKYKRSEGKTDVSIILYGKSPPKLRQRQVLTCNLLAATTDWPVLPVLSLIFVPGFTLTTSEAANLLWRIINFFLSSDICGMKIIVL